MDHKLTARIAAALCALILAGCAPGGGLTGKPAPKLELPDLEGKPRSLEEFKGKVVLLDFWATWCGPCQDELPDLKRLHQDYHAKGLEIVGVSLDSLKPEAVAEFAREKKIGYTLLYAGGEQAPGYPIRGLPTAWLIGRDGVVVKKYSGGKNYPNLVKAVEKLL